MVFGKSKEQKAIDELNKSNKTTWVWLKTFEKWFQSVYKRVAKLEKENIAQTNFDNQVVERLKVQDSKINADIDIAKRLKDLEQKVAALQSVSHSHKAVKE